MAEKHKGNGHKTETPDVSHIRNVEVTHETSDISVRGVLTFVVVLTLATAAISVGMWVLFRYFEAQEAKEPTRGPMALTKKEQRLPPEPRLQSAPGFGITFENGQTRSLERAEPQAAYNALRAQWDENLKTGSKDQTGKVVGMPIDQAMKQIISSGLSTWVKGPGGKLSDYAISTPTAWSSGRVVEKRLQ